MVEVIVEMSENIQATIERCDKTAYNLNMISIDKIQKWKIQQMQMRVKKVSVLLVENKNSLWIRTKEGRLATSQIRESCLKVDQAIDDIIKENDQKKAQTLVHTLEEHINTLEKNSNIIREEIRKRAMSIT